MRIDDTMAELARRKEEEGWTCQDIGLRCGLSANTIQRWLRGGGQGGIRVSTLSSLARGMGYVFRLAGKVREASGPMRLTDVAGALDAIRKERGLVAADLVRKGGPTTNIVRDLLDGRRDGMVSTLAGVAAALGQEIEMARKGANHDKGDQAGGAPVQNGPPEDGRGQGGYCPPAGRRVAAQGQG